MELLNYIPLTGDYDDIIVWIVLAVVALVVIGVVAFLRFRKK